MRLPLVALLATCALAMADTARSGAAKDTPESKPPAESSKGSCQYTIRVAIPVPEDTVYTKYTRRAYREYEQKTKLGLCVDLRAGTAWTEAELVNMVRNGTLDTAGVTNASLEHDIPELMVLSLPFLFETEDEMDFIAGKYEPYFRKLAEKKGFYASLYPLGLMPIFTTSVTTLDLDAEMATRKIWTYQGSEFVKAGLRAVGARHPVSLDLADVGRALRSGAVEVVFVPPALAVVLGWYPYIRQVVMVEFTAGLAVSLSNLAFVRKVPEDLLSSLEETDREVRRGIVRLFRRDDEIALLGMMKRGAKIVHPPADEVEKMRSTMKSFWEYGVGKWYPRELLDDIVRDLEEYRANRKVPD